MAGIITDVKSDIQRLKDLKAAIDDVKKSIKSIDVSVDINIAKDLEPKLKSLTAQYDKLAFKILKTEATIANSVKNIVTASDKIIQAQEKLSKVAKIPTQTGNISSQVVNTGETATIQAQAKAYEELSKEINNILGTREANVKRMVDEMNAIRLINAEIKKITKSQGEHSTLSLAQQARLEQLNNSLLTHKTALSEVRQAVSNNVKLDNAAATSMKGLSQSLSRMKIAYRELTEEERSSLIGKELLTSINQADAKIKKLDATIGNHQRNVGNYGKQWNGLSMSIQQVGRELPSLAYGSKVFFSAISNNLPILADEIKRARTEYGLLKKSGQSATPVWKQVITSLLSWQTALTVGITLLTLYGDKIVDWVGGLFQAKKALSETYQTMDAFQKNVSKTSSSLVATLERLSQDWKRLGNDINAQKKFILDNKDAISSMGVSVNDAAEAERIFNSNKDTFILGILQRAKAAATMELAAEEYKKAVQKIMEADAKSAEGVSFGDKLKSWFARSAAGEDTLGHLLNADLSPGAFAKDKEEKLRKEAETLFKSGSELVQKYVQFSEEERKILESIGIKTTKTIIEGSVEAIEAVIALKQQSLKKVTDPKEYARIEAEIKAEQAKLDAITGKLDTETAKRLKAQQDLSRSILDSELKLQSERIAIMQDGKDKRVLLADQEYKETLATIQKEREEYQKKINESKGKEDPAVLQTFTDREGIAKNKRDTDVAKIAKDYSDQMKAIQSEVDSHFRSQLDNRLIDIDNYYKEQIKKAREAGETEEGDFIQMLINKRDAEKEYARKESVLSGVDFKEQVDLGNLSNSSGAYFVEETERQKTEILKKYALERIAILESLGDEQSRKESELLKIAVEGYNKALSKPSKKSINTLVDEKAIKALQKHFMNLGASEEEAKKKAESFAETFQGKMQTVSEVTGLLKDVFGGISEELDMALDAIGNIAKGFAEGGLIGGISAAAGQLISVVSNLFTAKREIDKSMVEGYEAYMGAINELIDTQVALLDKLGGMAFGQNIIDTTKDIAKSIAASRTLFNEAMRAGSGVFSHSDGYKANKMLKGYARELREVGIYTTDLNRMTNEQLASLKKLPEVYARLPEGLRKYIDAIAEGLDKTEEFKEQIQDTVLGLDFTSIADMIVNSITDPSIDNALEEFEANIDKTIASIVQNMLRRNMLLGPLEKMTADLYKSMEKKDKNGNTYYKLTADAARDFKENVLGLGKQFDNAWKELEEAFRASGIDLMPKKEEVETDASDNSLKGAFAKASEESIGLLAGQFGAIRVILEEMKNSMVPIREQMQLIYALQTKGWEDVRAIRELTNKVEKNTDKITEIAERLEDTVGEISKDTRRSADVLDGGTINTKIRM